MCNIVPTQVVYSVHTTQYTVYTIHGIVYNVYVRGIVRTVLATLNKCAVPF